MKNPAQFAKMPNNTIKLALYIQKMEDLIKKVDEGFNSNAEQHKEICTMLKEMLDKKADKWVEKVLVWAGITLATLVIAVISYLVDKTVFR